MLHVARGTFIRRAFSAAILLDVFLGLVSCPRNSRYIAGGQWAVFQGAVRAGLAVKYPYLSHTGRASNAEKQPTGPGPRVAMKMGRRLRCSSVTYRFRYAPSTASPARTALPTAHFDRNNIPAISGTGHYQRLSALLNPGCYLLRLRRSRNVQTARPEGPGPSGRMTGAKYILQEKPGTARAGTPRYLPLFHDASLSQYPAQPLAIPSVGPVLIRL